MRNHILTNEFAVTEFVTVDDSKVIEWGMMGRLETGEWWWQCCDGGGT